MSAIEDIESFEFEDVLSEISGAFVRATEDQISPQIDEWLQRIVLALGIDRARVAQFDPADGLLYTTHQWVREGVIPTPRVVKAYEVLPWVTAQTLAGESVILSRVEDVPPEAAKDLEFWRMVDTKSIATIPLTIGEVVAGSVAFVTVNRVVTWLPRTVKRLRLIAEVFGNALERQRKVAEVRQLRDEMRQTSRIATMGELTASLAHELSQPLGAILSNAQAAQRFLAAKKPDFAEVEAAIADIIRDNSRAVQTLRNVRALFQREQIEMSPVDPRLVLLEAERVLRVEASSKGISIELDLPASLPAVVGNRAQLLEVLMNLATNAFDSICDDGDGRRVVSLSARHSGDGRVQIAVRDSGKGIDPEVMPRLFDAFFTTKPSGMGIGLRIARSIIENHGGRLWATRNPDRGATLEFELPVKSHEEGSR